MSDVRFRNLDNVPLQEEFNASTVFKISTASKIAALVIGIVSICVFTLTDNAKTAVTTIEAQNLNGNCAMLSSFTNGNLEAPKLTQQRASDFLEGYKKLVRDVTELADVSSLITERINRIAERLKDSALSYNSEFFRYHQDCIDQLSKPAVCTYLNTNGGDSFDRPNPYAGLNMHRNVCFSYLDCSWSGTSIKGQDFQVALNVTFFKCLPSVNFTTCDEISSKCPVYARFAAEFGRLLSEHIHPPESLCIPFKKHPPYSCSTFHVVSPIQIISQTLSLMATTLGGSELLLYVLLKYRHVWPSSLNAVTPESSNLP
jgi:hypothetical protein